MRSFAAALGVALGVCMLLLAPSRTERASALATYSIGDPVLLPVLDDLDGRPVNLAAQQALARADAVVIEFVSAHCPVSWGYRSKVAALRERYAGRPVEFVTLTACAGDDPAELRAQLARHGGDPRLLVDPSGRLPRQLGVRKTPHFVLLDARRELVYSGAFDANLVAPGAAPDRYLQNALDAVLAGDSVALPRTRVFGTPICRPQRTAGLQ